LDSFNQLQQNGALINLIASIVEKVILSRGSESLNLDMISGLAAGVASSQYVETKMKGAQRFPNSLELIDFACAHARVDGLALEFGVFSGTTINRIAQSTMAKVYGFDSFEGLPEGWRPGYEKGIFARPDLPQVAKNVELVVGWFDRTLPGFLDQHPGPVSLLHVDCDIYSSTQTVLTQLRDRIVPGTVIVFDEYFNYPGWELHEYKAFKEFVETAGIRYQYIGFVPSHQQVAVRVVAVGNR
jgi:hypothetical protein